MYGLLNTLSVLNPNMAHIPLDDQLATWGQVNYMENISFFLQQKLFSYIFVLPTILLRPTICELQNT